MYGADTGLHFTSTAKTNSLGEVRAVDFFTRDGQTNLVRLTVMQKAKSQASTISSTTRE
jgi:hypothetical protein